jgi:pyrrolidone-carboxylate peptidase
VADLKTLVTKSDLERAPDKLSAVGSELRVLVTGFVAFGDDVYNPSGVTARWLHGKRVDALGHGGYYTARIIGRGDIPVRFGDESDSAADAVLQAILDVRPDVVLCLGQGEDVRFRVELRARDNSAHHDPRVRTSTPEYRSVYTTGLDADRVVGAIRSVGGDAVSFSDAGFYVCEDLFYHLMRFVETRPGDVDIRAAGFIHVPRYVAVDVGSVAGQAAGDTHDRKSVTSPTPNSPAKPGEVPVKQSTINDAIYKAVEAVVAGVPQYEAPPGRRSGPRVDWP